MKTNRSISACHHWLADVWTQPYYPFGKRFLPWARMVSYTLASEDIEGAEIRLRGAQERQDNEGTTDYTFCIVQRARLKVAPQTTHALRSYYAASERIDYQLDLECHTPNAFSSAFTKVDAANWTRSCFLQVEPLRLPPPHSIPSRVSTRIGLVH
jgi:hypothetical protein